MITKETIKQHHWHKHIHFYFCKFLFNNESIHREKYKDAYKEALMNWLENYPEDKEKIDRMIYMIDNEDETKKWWDEFDKKDEKI
jgi:hypothetical protein